MKWHGAAKCVIIKSRARSIPKKKEPKIEIIFLAKFCPTCKSCTKPCLDYYKNANYKLYYPFNNLAFIGLRLLHVEGSTLQYFSARYVIDVVKLYRHQHYINYFYYKDIYDLL